MAPWSRSFFFFNDTATTEIYTLSLHDALPISAVVGRLELRSAVHAGNLDGLYWRYETWIKRLESHFGAVLGAKDRKSTRLNSSHGYISYAVFCLKKNIVLRLVAGMVHLRLQPP